MSLQILFLFVFKLFYTGGEEKRRERNSPLLKNKFLNFWGGPGRTAQSCQNGPIYYHATCLHIELITLPHCKPTCIFVYLCSPLSLTHAPHTNSHYSQLSMAECRNHRDISLWQKHAPSLTHAHTTTPTNLSVWQLWCWRGFSPSNDEEQNLNNGKMIHDRS